MRHGLSFPFDLPWTYEHENTRLARLDFSIGCLVYLSLPMSPVLLLQLSSFTYSSPTLFHPIKQTVHRNDALRKQVLDGTLPPTNLLSLPIEALRTEAEKDAAKAVETKEVLGYSHSHVFSDVIFEEAAKGVAGNGGGTGGKCRQCESTKVLFSRRQSYNESSTWCGEEQGAPVMMNCLSCGTIESIRE